MGIYFDNNATTPLDPEVLEAMLPYFREKFGNPSSGHGIGEQGKIGIEKARQQVADLLNCQPSRLIFTSSGSESNNLAIFSAVSAQPGKKHIISTQTEHASVLEPLKLLKRQGHEVEVLAVDEKGMVSTRALAEAIRHDTALVSIMAANNETGVIFPCEEIGAICGEKGVLFHCDAVQAVGKERLDLAVLPIDYLTVSGHKLHGPKGAGVLYVSPRAPVSPMIHGGGQEKGKRSGTENVPALVGFGKACELSGAALPAFQDSVGSLRDYLEKKIVEMVPDVIINGSGAPRLANTSSLSFKYCSSAALIQELDARGFAVSAHSACHGGDLDPSHVLTAMRVAEDYLHGTLRVSLSRINSAEEVAAFIEILPGIVKKSRVGLAV